MSYTDIQICNLALAQLGDIATAVSISAPTTPQERYCATFYPMARDIALGARTWSFATTRKALVASAVTPPSTWQYAYALPATMDKFLAVLDANASDDYSSAINFTTTGISAAPIANLGVRTPYPFVIERDVVTNAMVLFTNVASAVGRYTLALTDTTLFPIEFVNAVAFRLAAFLAGPIIKTDAGAKMSMEMLKQFGVALAEAAESDADQQQVELVGGAPWITGRG